MNRLAMYAVILAGAVLFAGGSANASVPSSGATVATRTAAKDLNGNLFSNGNSDIGYKVFTATSTSPMVLLDEAGVVITNGLIHQVCVSSGATTEWAIVYDSAPPTLVGFASSALAANYQYQITPPVNRVVASEHCSPILDAQFNYGAVVYLPVSAGQPGAHVYWRPSNGLGD